MDDRLVDAIRANARPLHGSDDLDGLLEAIGEARFVLLGESTHGTHEFYATRARLTRRLVAERGFAAVAIEGDGPDARAVDLFVRGAGDDEAIDALAGFRRFPQWMWRNADVLDLVGWLRAHDEALPFERRVAFHGLDLYALHAAIAAVIAWLDRVDPEAAERARERYACFEDVGADPHDYGSQASWGIRPDCAEAVSAQLVEMLRGAGARLAGIDGLASEDDFFALESARLVADAEAYYKAAFAPGGVRSWNVRDTHMADTLDALAAHLARRGRPSKAVVWAHNSHVGDARFSQLGRSGEVSLGGLVRERHGDDAFVLGFATHHGTVTAADAWDGPARRMVVRPAQPGSYEDLFHRTGIGRFWLDLRNLGEAAGALAEERLERAIGVVYKPALERYSHLFEASLPRRFDALVFVDETRAVEPLERSARWEAGELPETYPSGF